MVIRMDESGRRCDESCYDAHGLTCACICHGKNHGQGLAKALANEGLKEDSMDEGMEDDTYEEEDSMDEDGEEDIEDEDIEDEEDSDGEEE